MNKNVIRTKTLMSMQILHHKIAIALFRIHVSISITQTNAFIHILILIILHNILMHVRTWMFPFFEKKSKLIEISKNTKKKKQTIFFIERPYFERGKSTLNN